MKIAKVIVTSFMPRSVREHSALTGHPLGYFVHSQNFPTRRSIIDLINFTIDVENKADPGAKVDLIIVNNDIGWEEGNSYLNELNNRQLKHGSVRVLHRENYGRSFGGYNHAFNWLKDCYDYFIFTEDDIIVARDGYASIALETFLDSDNCGFVAYQGISDAGLDLPREDAIAVHGGVGFTSTKVLQDVVRQYGVLPHALKGTSQAHVDIIRNGEIPFTNIIYKMGYGLKSINKKLKLYDFAYDLMRGLDVPRFASLADKLLFFSKKKLYNNKFVRHTYHFLKK
jgi:hypothetical protein